MGDRTDSFVGGTYNGAKGILPEKVHLLLLFLLLLLCEYFNLLLIRRG